MDDLIKAIAALSVEYADAPMLARTHGQPASPTTMGKEMANFAYHLKLQRDQVRKIHRFPDILQEGESTWLSYYLDYLLM